MKRMIQLLFLFMMLSFIAECNESKYFNAMTKRPKPPEKLYYVVPDKKIKKTLTVGVRAREGKYLVFFNDTQEISDLLDKDPEKFNGISLILQINTKQMIIDGYKIIGNKKGKWFTKMIPSQYISVLK